MKNKAAVFVLVIGVIVGAAIFSIETGKSEDGFEERREKVLSQLFSAVERAKMEGKYECCIDPPCTMCYLGDWIWEDGTCDCDGMIANKEWDKVCPQCIRGIEEGRCKSETDSCPIL